MKKKLLLSLALLATHFTYAQFTPDNLVVARAEATTNTTAAVINLFEYKTDGSVVSSTVVGNSNFYVGASASTLADGMLSLSTDGKLLTMYGYSVLAPDNDNIQTTTATYSPRTLAVIDADKVQHLFTIPNVHDATAARSAIANLLTTNSYGVYLGGGKTSATQGMQYVVINTANYTIGTPSSIAAYNTKSVKIFNNQLYATSAQTSNYFSTIGSGIPVANKQTVTALSPMNSLTNPGDFVFFDTNLLYIADETTSTGGIYKFYFDGTNWVAKGKVQSGINGDLLFRGLTGRLENGKVTLYGVTTMSKGNSIVKIVDETAANATITNGTTGVTLTTIATATSTTGFRGISFTPNSTITLPVSLNSFTAKAINGNIVLNWSTASEQNNKYFEVLRSTDGISFSRIGEIAGKNNSSTYNQYNFTDYTPASGTNYYQLKQVDLNGNSEVFGPVSAHINLENAGDFRVVTSAEGIKAILKSDKTTESKVTVTDISGRTYFSKNIQLKKGDNTIDINTQIPNGIYIIKIESPGFSDTLKFKK